MDSKYVPPHVCLATGYKEEESLFRMELPKCFNIELIKMYFKRCINDGFLFWPFHFSFEQFLIFLNNLHSSLKFTLEKAETMVTEREITFQELSFLDV